MARTSLAERPPRIVIYIPDVEYYVMRAASPYDVDRCLRSEGGPAMKQILDPVTQHHINQAADRLAEEFEGIFSQETIARQMVESTDVLGAARDNVVVLVHAPRFCLEPLRAGA